MRTAVRTLGRVLLAGSFLSFGIVFHQGNARILVDITQGIVRPIPVAVQIFQPGVSSEGGLVNYGRIVTRVVEANLRSSGLFTPVRLSSTREGLTRPPEFEAWRVLGVQILVVGEVRVAESGPLELSFRLWDIFVGEELTNRNFRLAPEQVRRAGHKVADIVYTRLTGEEPYFDTRILYISETGPEQNRKKRLALMDQDGANHFFLTDGSDLVATPRFARDRQRLTYLSIKDEKYRIVLLDLARGTRRYLSAPGSLYFSPRFSPDGKRLIFTIARRGNSDLYEMVIETRALRRLTFQPAIDTSPSYDPSGRAIVFTSDRSGRSQLYRLRLSSRSHGPRRISFGPGAYSTPVWSPRGDLIAFTKIERGEFKIGVMNADGTAERILDAAVHAEGPSWAPNGRVLMYFKELRLSSGEKKSFLYTIDLTGFNPRRVLTPFDGSDPTWSPLL